LTTSPTLQPHFSAHAGISHPLRLASWGHEEPIALIVEYILVSSRRAPTFGLSPGEGSCGAGQCPRDKVTEQTIGKPLNRVSRELWPNKTMNAGSAEVIPGDRSRVVDAQCHGEGRARGVDTRHTATP